MARTRQLLFGFVCLVALIAAPACGPSTAKMSVTEYKDYLGALVNVAQENGVALVLTARLTGNPNVYAKQEFGLDLGVSAEATFQVNPAAAALHRNSGG